MKQKLLLSFVVLVSVFVFSPRATAETLDLSISPWEISGQIGAAFPKEDDEDTGFFLMARATYDVIPNVAVGGTLGWLNFSQEFNNADYGDISGVPMLATVILRVPIESTENRLVPYVVGGLGGIFWYYRESDLLEDNGISVDNDFAFAGQIGAGIDYYFTDNTAVFAEGSYIFSNYDAKIRAGGSVAAAEADTDAFFLGAGLKMRM